LLSTLLARIGSRPRRCGPPTEPAPHSDPAGCHNRPSQTHARTAAARAPLPAAPGPAAKDPARTGSVVLCWRLDIRTALYWAASRLNAVLISARWVSAWGKLPQADLRLARSLRATILRTKPPTQWRHYLHSRAAPHPKSHAGAWPAAHEKGAASGCREGLRPAGNGDIMCPFMYRLCG